MHADNRMTVYYIVLNPIPETASLLQNPEIPTCIACSVRIYQLSFVSLLSSKISPGFATEAESCHRPCNFINLPPGIMQMGRYYTAALGYISKYLS